MLSSKFCEIFKSSFFCKTSLVATSVGGFQAAWYGFEMYTAEVILTPKTLRANIWFPLMLLQKQNFSRNIIVYFNRSRKCSVKRKITLTIFVVYTIIIVWLCVYGRKGTDQPPIYTQLWEFKIHENWHDCVLVCTTRKMKLYIKNFFINVAKSVPNCGLCHIY